MKEDSVLYKPVRTRVSAVDRYIRAQRQPRGVGNNVGDLGGDNGLELTIAKGRKGIVCARRSACPRKMDRVTAHDEHVYC